MHGEGQKVDTVHRMRLGRLDLASGIRKQGCGVGVEAAVGLVRSRPFFLESESELEPVKFCRLRLRSGVAGYQPLTDNDSGRTVIHRPENIDRGRKRTVAMWS